VEAEDGFLRLDRDLGDFFAFLDRQIGAGQYLVFLTADHGVAQIPEFMTAHKLPAGRIMTGPLEDQLNKALQEKFGPAKLVLSDYNYQLHLNHRVIDSTGIPMPAIEEFITRFLEREIGIDRVFPLRELNTTPLPARIRDMLNNGWHPDRSGDIQLIFKPHYIDAYSNTGTTHGLWNPYDARIPLLWFGWGITPGSSHHEINMTDIAPTLAALLKIQEPSGSVGKVITELVK
jgi:arylsulfatase A-like enzyme